MAKYKLEMYGWEVEATGHSITDEQVKKIQDLMFSKEQYGLLVEYNPVANYNHQRLYLNL